MRCFAGIDIGSVATKAVIVSDGKMIGHGVVESGVDPAALGESALALALQNAGRSKADIEATVATGYGRRAASGMAKVVTEIRAAARGAHAIGAPWGAVRTIVDLGGQDTKVITLEDSGAVADFAMNDKCAAGTGRFLSLMAQTLGVPLSEMGAMSQLAETAAAINSTCAVFAESEVISLVAQGKTREEIIAGLHQSIAARIASMVRQLGGREVFFCGGGARNEGVRKALESALEAPVFVPPNPQFIIAYGAALIAEEK